MEWIAVTFGVLMMGGMVAMSFYDSGKATGIEMVQEEAIEAGVGYWGIDEKTGERSFKWRTPEAD